MSNLENLKKQAKALVRLHRERSYHLAVVARETLPKYAALSDRQMLAADFRLADAQALVARQHGYDDWAALKAAAATQAPPPREQGDDAPGLHFIVPILRVADVKRSLACYDGQLGFAVLQVSGDPPFYAEVRRGGVSIGLSLSGPPRGGPDCEDNAMAWAASIRVGDIKALYLEILASGAAIALPLQRDPFGPQFFAVRDPDGHLLGFSERGPAAKARGLIEAAAR